MTILGITIAVVAMVGVVYPHTIYPLLLLVARRMFAKPVHESAVQRPVDIIIAAYNEEECIIRCLDSIVASNYPTDLLHVRIGDDGSTDATAELVNDYIARHPNVDIELRRFPRSGKNGVLRSMIADAGFEILVFCDADTVLHADAIAMLLTPFADDSVGAVVGKMDRSRQLTSNMAVEQGEAVISSVDDVMNSAESAINSTVASNGALYAVQRSLLRPFPNSRVADDWYNVLCAALNGLRIVFQPRALVKEERTSKMMDEVRRTTRTASAGMATVLALPSLLSPTRSWLSFFLWSHRVMRWFSPLFLLLLMVGTALTVRETMVFGVLFYSQFTLYALALLGHAAAINGQKIPLVSTVYFFVAMNASFFFAWMRLFGRSGFDIWDPSRGLGEGA